MDLYFDRNNKPISVLDWAKKIENHKYRKVKLTRLGDCNISTIWFGLLGYGLRPMIFETAVYGPGAPEWLKGNLVRYPTEVHARFGHKGIKEAVLESRRLRVDGREYRRRRSTR